MLGKKREKNFTIIINDHSQRGIPYIVSVSKDYLQIGHETSCLPYV